MHATVYSSSAKFDANVRANGCMSKDCVRMFRGASSYTHAALSMQVDYDMAESTHATLCWWKWLSSRSKFLTFDIEIIRDFETD